MKNVYYSKSPEHKYDVCLVGRRSLTVNALMCCLRFDYSINTSMHI